MSKTDDFFNTRETGQLLGLSPDHVRRLCAQGKLEAKKLGHDWLIHLKAINRFKKKRVSKKEVTEDGTNSNQRSVNDNSEGSTQDTVC